MADIKGLSELKAKLAKIVEKLSSDQSDAGKGNTVIVGYTANYAIYVHEDLTKRHAGYTFVSYKSGKRREYIGVGQAKFLEQPFRELKQELIDITCKTVRAGYSVIQGLYLAGLRLQRESQKIVPVDTSDLKNSAFTRVVQE